MAIIKTCDKCGDRINMNPMSNTILPSFTIKKLSDFMMGWVNIDLCPNCEKELNAWLNDKTITNTEEKKYAIDRRRCAD